jgi:hypothetical protein
VRFSIPKRITGPVFRWFAFAAFLSMIVIVLSGAAVRLTGSGLGCPDWPTCFHHRLTGSWSIHPLIEYANRVVTILLVCVTALTFIAALLREVRRRDLIVLSVLLVLGVVADAVLGAFVVYSKLNPWLVASHMLLSLSMVVVGAVLYHRSKYVYGPGTRSDVRDPHFRFIARLLWIPFVVLLATGTMTTGSGPHAGSSQGQLVALAVRSLLGGLGSFTDRGALCWPRDRPRLHHLEEQRARGAAVGSATTRHHFPRAGGHWRNPVPHPPARLVGRTSRRGRGVIDYWGHPISPSTVGARSRTGDKTRRCGVNRPM